MKFLDEATIEVFGGQGGDGCSSFRREKYVPKGGPDGGDGGKGGDVIVRADQNAHTLLDVKYRRIFRATDGEHGKGNQMYGRAGKDVIIKLPIGTVIWDVGTGLPIADLSEHNQDVVVARGGRGGRGNMHFATPTHQAPREKEAGGLHQHRTLRLELKLLADVGLIGFPNTGKSTLISVISNARPKVADYPFTTLVPNLGVVQLDIDRGFTVADIPGLIEGAHTGAGLGIKFLKHIERTKVLVHLVDPTDMVPGDPIDNYHKLRHELASYSELLMERPEIIVITKADAITEPEMLKNLVRKLKRINRRVFVISAVKKEGIKPLLNEIWKIIRQSAA